MVNEEGNVLFNDALNTFYLRLYGVGHSDSERKPAAATVWATLSISSKGISIPDRLAYRRKCFI